MFNHLIIITAFTLSGLFGSTNICKKASIAWSVGWSCDDKFVAVGNDAGELIIYETEQWKKIKHWGFGASTVTRVKWNPKYPILAVAAFSHEEKPMIVQLYDAEKNQIISDLPDTLMGRALSWRPNGEEVAFVGAKGRISIYTKLGKHLKTLSFTNQGSLFDTDWHPAKNILLAVEENIYLLDVDRDSLLTTYEDGSQNKGILCCAWHTSGTFFVTGDYGHENSAGSEPSYLKFFSSQGILLKTIRQAKAEYRNVKWTKNGKYLAAAADALLIFNNKGEMISKTKFDGNNVWGVDWNNKGDRIISSDGAGKVRITNIKGKLLKTFVLN